MTDKMLLRGVVTDAFVEHLQGSALLTDRTVLVGDGLVPDEAGWQGAQRGKGTYVASVKVSTGLANVRDAPPIGSRNSSWVARYGLRVLGGTRTQADNAGDLVRTACLGFRGLKLPCGSDGSTYKVTDVVFSNLGPVVPDLGEDPPLWALEETAELWLDRDRT